MPEPGDILHYKDFTFQDGYKAHKLFVILNKVKDINSPYLVLKTTSQSSHYIAAEQGCNPELKVFFVPVDQDDCFKVDTYIKLPQIIEITTLELLQGSLSSRKIHVVNSLSSNCLTQLKACLRQFKKDISPQHWKLIFQS